MTITNDAARAVYEQITAIEAGTLETEAAVDAAWLAYCALDDAAKAELPPDRILALREEVADCYARTDRKGARVDRSKILIGAYCLNFADEQHIMEAAEAGIDFFVSLPLDSLDLLAKYGIGAITHINNYGYPYWRGGDRPMGSDPLTPNFTIEDFKASLLDDIDHEALWGLSIVDEPYTDDFWHYDAVKDALYEKYPDYLVDINLFPSYANSDQLGSETYQDHIDEYIAQVDIDFISYDHYMYRGGRCNLIDAIENLRIVANACRENDRDMWVILQANNTEADLFTSLDQLRYQANTALAYGAAAINWACWNPGWWENNVYDAEGNKTEQYDKVKQVNAEINTLSPVYIKYTNLDTALIGAKMKSGMSQYYRNDDNIMEQNVFTDLTVGDETSSILCGYFEKRIGEGSAMLFVNITDRMCEETPVAPIRFRVADDDVVTLHTADGSVLLTPDADGFYSMDVVNAAYAFVTVD